MGRPRSQVAGTPERPGGSGRFRRLVAAVAVLAAAPAGAQEGDTIPTPAPPAADTAGAAPRAPYSPPRLALTLTVGTLGFGDLQRQGATANLLDGAGEIAATDTLSRTLQVAGGVQLGASALLGLTPAWALRGGASWGRGRLRAAYSGDDALARDAARLAVDADDDLAVLSVEAALRFRFVSRRRMQPYAELGASAVRIEAADPGFPGATALTGETRLAGLAAIGAVIPLWEAVTVRAQATGHFFRTPAAPAPAGMPIAAVDTLALFFNPPGSAPFADAAVEVTRVLRLDLGLSFELGSAGRPRAAAAAPPSGARR